MGIRFECAGVAWELTLVKVFLQIVGKQGHTFGYLGRLDSGHIVYILLRRDGVIWIKSIFSYRFGRIGRYIVYI